MLLIYLQQLNEKQAIELADFLKQRHQKVLITGSEQALSGYAQWQKFFKEETQISANEIEQIDSVLLLESDDKDNRILPYELLVALFSSKYLPILTMDVEGMWLGRKNTQKNGDISGKRQGEKGGG